MNKPVLFICRKEGERQSEQSKKSEIQKAIITRQKNILRTIDLLEMNGPLLREPYSKPLENGIFELRTKQGSDITRVLYFFIVGKKAVLTNGFIKKSQKTPKAEKELAKKYKADYERRYGNE